jgi:hypothetical protein
LGGIEFMRTSGGSTQPMCPDAAYDQRAKAIADRVVGSITASVTRARLASLKIDKIDEE